MSNEGLRYDENKPMLHRIHPIAWASAMLPALPSDLLAVNEYVDTFFFQAQPSLNIKAWSYIYSDDLTDMAHVLSFGAKKYEEWNWLKGMKWSRVFNSFRRHLLAIARGETIDPESGLTHRGHLACNLMFLHVYSELGIGEDDRPKFKEAK